MATKPTGRPRGRGKGSKASAHLKIAADTLASGITPLQVLLTAMRFEYARFAEAGVKASKLEDEIKATPNPPEDLREEYRENLRVARDHLNEAARHGSAAAPYVHPKLTSTEVKGDKSAPLTVQIVRFSDLPTED